MTATEIYDIVTYEHLDKGLIYDTHTKSFTDGDMVIQAVPLNDDNCTTIRVFFKTEPNIEIRFNEWDYDGERNWICNVFNIELTKRKLSNVWYAEKGFCFLNGKIY